MTSDWSDGYCSSGIERSRDASASLAATLLLSLEPLTKLIQNTTQAGHAILSTNMPDSRLHSNQRRVPPSTGT
jgi:hypothetical protein